MITLSDMGWGWWISGLIVVLMGICMGGLLLGLGLYFPFEPENRENGIEAKIQEIEQELEQNGEPPEEPQEKLKNTKQRLESRLEDHLKIVDISEKLPIILGSCLAIGLIFSIVGALLPIDYLALGGTISLQANRLLAFSSTGLLTSLGIYYFSNPENRENIIEERIQELERKIRELEEKNINNSIENNTTLNNTLENENTTIMDEGLTPAY